MTFHPENIDKLILEKFTPVFLGVSEGTAKVGYNWDKLLEEFFPQLGIIYGYFAEYDPNRKIIEYIVDKNTQLESAIAIPGCIPYFLNGKKNHRKELYKRVIENSKKEFNALHDAPKLYQHLPVQLRDNNLSNSYISSFYLNNYIHSHDKIKENDYYVVLYDEISFFQYAYLYLLGNCSELTDFFEDRKRQKLYYLLKFAASVEPKVATNCQLNKHLDIDHNKWGCADENQNRKDVEAIVTKEIKNENWFKKALDCTNEIIDQLLKKCAQSGLFRLTDEDRKPGTDQLALLKCISRFDIESSFLIVDENDRQIFHDFFVFPLYTEPKPIDTVAHIHLTEKVKIYSPVMVALYIKTLHEIANELVETEQYDETVDSIQGFEFTKEIAKQFGTRIIQDDYLKNVITKEITPHSLRAAISQVMTRNMSHNIGSHVLNNLTDGVELSKNRKVKCVAYQPSKELRNLGADGKIIHQLAIFNNYVKCRMDYLSDITFGIPVMHTNKKIYEDIYKDFDRVRLLLDHISGLSQNFRYEVRFCFDGKPLIENKERAIAMPNDVLGCQAFYNILENVIRNSAKHNQHKEPGVVTTFTVNFTEIEDPNFKEVIDRNTYYRVEVYDDIAIDGDMKSVGEGEEDKTEQYFVDKKITPGTPISQIDWLIYLQNKKLNASVLEDFKLRNSALGLLEMKASAAYLRKLDVVDIGSREYQVSYDEGLHVDGKLNIIKAFAKNNCLAYSFFVSKPTEYLFVGNIENYDLNRIEELNKMGIWIWSEQEFARRMPLEVLNHQFIFYYPESEEVEELIMRFKTRLPLRKIKLDNNAAYLLYLLETADFHDIEKEVWKLWFDEIRGEYEIVNVFCSYEPDEHNQRGRYNLAFSDHLSTWNDSYKDYKEKNIDFIEALSNLAIGKLPYYNKYKNITNYTHYEENNLTLQQMLFEAAQNKVLVIDERIQRFANTKYYSNKTSVLHKVIFRCTNVMIPDSNLFMLDADNYDPTLVEALELYINNEVSKHNFLLIHYSILERMFGSKNTRINKHLEDWARITRVIVTSGRGKPKELPDEVCYVNLSPVLNVFTQARSKYSINYLLNQARI